MQKNLSSSKHFMAIYLCKSNLFIFTGHNQLLATRTACPPPPPPWCLENPSLISGHVLCIYLHTKPFSFAIETVMGRIKQ